MGVGRQGRGGPAKARIMPVGTLAACAGTGVVTHCGRRPRKTANALCHLECDGGRGIGGALVAVLRLSGPRYHNIPASEIHPDLAVDEELLKDALSEYERSRS